MPRALVMGVNGQDGSYAAEALLHRGYEVIGLGRQPSSRYVPPQPGFDYRMLDLADGVALDSLLTKMKPDYVFHLAAVHGPNAPSYEAVFHEMMAVNVLSLHRALEFARREKPDMRLAYANSAKIFGAALVGRIDEDAPRVTSCLYSNTKNSAFDLIGHYRQNYGVAASNLILFNHDSPRRPPGFFLPDLADCLSKALVDPTATITFRNMDFYVDWSDAAEIMDLAVDVAERPEGMDVIIASGITSHGRDFVNKLFDGYGLDYRRHVFESAPMQRHAKPFEASTERLMQAIGRRPRHGIHEILDAMLPQRQRRQALGAA